MFIAVKKKIPFFKFFYMFLNPSTSTSFLECVDDIFSKISSRINTFLFRQIRLECLIKDESKAVPLDTMFVFKYNFDVTWTLYQRHERNVLIVHIPSWMQFLYAHRPNKGYVRNASTLALFCHFGQWKSIYRLTTIPNICGMSRATITWTIGTLHLLELISHFLTYYTLTIYYTQTTYLY